jgi:hypothetical protein
MVGHLPDPAANDAGNLSGTVSGNGVSMVLSPSVPTYCPYSVNAQVSGNRMDGTYATFNCTVAVTGTINLVKQ